jgi:5'-3' exonuclease
MPDFIEKERRPVPDFDECIIDADSLMYMIAWVSPNQKQAEQSLMQKIEEIIHSVEARDVTVYIKGRDNFRYQVDPEYKANRKQRMDPEVMDRVELLYSFARKNFIESHLGEADDYATIHMYQAMAEGKIPCVAHIDKDLNMIPGWHFNFKKKEFYFMEPEESFTFMCRQILSGDMSSDNIPGLKGVGDSTAAKILHNTRLSGMKDVIIKEWRTSHRPINDDDDKTRYNTPDKRYQRMLDSANCLIMREADEELRPLTEQEILTKMSWNYPETDYLFHKDRDVSDMVLLNSLPINCYMETKRPVRCKKDTTATGKSLDSTVTPKNTSDSSTE